jgi:hypothetical protein
MPPVCGNWRNSYIISLSKGLDALEPVVNGKLLFFAALFPEPEQEPFSGRIIVFHFEVHGSADPGEGISTGPERWLVPDFAPPREPTGMLIFITL